MTCLLTEVRMFCCGERICHGGVCADAHLHMSLPVYTYAFLDLTRACAPSVAVA